MPAYNVCQQSLSVWYWQLPKFAQKEAGLGSEGQCNELLNVMKVS
jgi:hypothetical protein